MYSKLILRLNDDTYQSSCSRTEIKTNRNTLKYFARSELVLCTWIESCSIYLPPPWNVLFFKYYRYDRREKKTHTHLLSKSVTSLMTSYDPESWKLLRIIFTVSSVVYTCEVLSSNFLRPRLGSYLAEQIRAL